MAEEKTLGQVCFERMWQAQGAAPGAGIVQWAGVRPDVRAWWEAAAGSVKEAVLAEQGAPTGPAGMAEQERLVRHAIVDALTGHMARETAVLPVAIAVEDAIVAALKAWEVNR